jgi:hypothetical protein
LWAATLARIYGDPRAGALEVALLGLTEDVEIRRVSRRLRPATRGRTAGT